MRVLDGDQMIARMCRDARVRDRLGGVSQQRSAEHGVDPGAGNSGRPNMGPYAGLVSFDDPVQRCRIDVTFLCQHRLERADAQFDIR